MSVRNVMVELGTLLKPTMTFCLSKRQDNAVPRATLCLGPGNDLTTDSVHISACGPFEKVI